MNMLAVLCLSVLYLVNLYVIVKMGSLIIDRLEILEKHLVAKIQENPK